LEESFHFTAVETVDGAIPRAWWFEREVAPDLLDDVLGLIVAEVVFPPEAEGLADS
jgi:hypothetical protein